MHHSFFDKYSDLESHVHRMHPLVKLIAYVIVLVLILTVSIARPVEYLIPFVLLAVVVSLSRIPIRFIITKAGLLFPLVVTLVILLPFMKGETVLLESNTIVTLTITREAALLVVDILLKSLLILWWTVVLFSSTPFPRLLYALRMVKVPTTMITVFAFMYRYIFLLLDEMERMAIARQSRLARRETPARFFTSLYYLIRAIFIRSIDRSERTYQAMCARGFQGEVMVLDAPRAGVKDIVILAGFMVVVASLKVIL